MNFIDTLTDKLIKVGGELYPLLHLGNFFILGELRKKLRDAVNKKDKIAFSQTLKEIISLQTKGKYNPQTLLEELQAIQVILVENRIHADAVFLRPEPKTENEEISKSKILLYDYPGRTLAVWINEFARTYGWSLEQILDLNVDTAIYLYQEQGVSKQLQKEWDYALTELAYPYNKATERNEFKPLTRPYWMQEDIKASLPITRIKKADLPMGIVINVSGMELMAQNEQPTENTSETKDSTSA